MVFGTERIRQVFFLSAGWIKPFDRLTALSRVEGRTACLPQAGIPHVFDLVSKANISPVVCRIARARFARLAE
jgi:hypothetical protein